MNRPRVLRAFPASEIHPQGWFFRQLERQRDGLTGGVPDIWADLSEDSAWLGGNGEAWERGPYYLDGLVPLAWLTRDPVLTARKNRWVDALLKSQTSDGNFGPRRNPDIWPRLVAMKALWEEYESSKKAEIAEMLRRYCRFLEGDLAVHPPKFWASARAFEAMNPILGLKELTQDPALDHLIALLLNGMTDWFGLFRKFPYPEPTGRYLPRWPFRIAKAILGPLDTARKKNMKIRKPEPSENVEAFNARRTNRLMLETHGVNLAMALKYPTVYGTYIHDPELIELGKTAYRTLMRFHGTALGIHSADEHLSGPGAFQGTELCAVVEEMYSFEEMLRTTGDPEYADLLEFLAYNALPGMFTPDFCRHQYVGQANQIAADRAFRPFFDTNREGNIYGLAPNYGCCLANLHQGFPKFALHQVFQTETGLAFFGYAPLILETRWNGEKMCVEIAGEYPFEDRIVIRFLAVPAVPLTMDFRIPQGTSGRLHWKDRLLEDLPPGMRNLEGIFEAGEEIVLELRIPILSVTNPEGSVSFRKGSLLLALPLTPKTRTIRGSGKFTDVEMQTEDLWNLVPILDSDHPWLFTQRDIPDNPFDGRTPPWEILAPGVKVSNWKRRNGCAGTIPKVPQIELIGSIRLLPFGSTNLRISAFPDIRISQ